MNNSSMVSAIRLSSCLSRKNCIIFIVFLLILGFSLFILSDSSTQLIHQQIVTLKNENSKKADSHSVTNQSVIFSSYICDEHGPANNHSSILQPYCSKVPVPLNGWTRAERYNETDIGFIIISNSRLQQREIAIRDTWLARVTYRYFLSDQSYSSLPVEGDDDRVMNIKRIFHGLEMISNQQRKSSNPHKWYYLGSSDTFINVPHLLKKLDSYNYTKPLFLGSSFKLTSCLDSHGEKHDIEYPSSNAGVFLSSKLIQSMISQLPDYIEHLALGNNSDYSDVVLTCLVYKLGIRVTNMSGFWTPNSDRSLEFNGQEDANFDPEPNNFHSISSPDEMYHLDEFYSFLHTDRLINDRNWPELTNYIRTFMASHYETLRIKRNISSV